MIIAVALCICGMAYSITVFFFVLKNVLKLILYGLVGILVLLILYLYLYQNKYKLFDNKMTLNKNLDKDTYEQDGKFKEGDTFLGYDYEKDKPNIIPYKDRFKNTLVIGNANHNEIPQLLIPMVEKDLNYKDLGIVCIDSKGDFAEKVYALALEKGRGNKAIYFNPTLADCPKFNPMIGDIYSVYERLVTTFNKLGRPSNEWSAHENEILLKACIRITKWLYGDNANLNDISLLMNNTNGEGVKMLCMLNEMLANKKIKRY